jgi:hypothetical protein
MTLMNRITLSPISPMTEQLHLLRHYIRSQPTYMQERGVIARKSSRR